jgi:hypothetical protein
MANPVLGSVAQELGQAQGPSAPEPSAFSGCPLVHPLKSIRHRHDAPGPGQESDPVYLCSQSTRSHINGQQSHAPIGIFMLCGAASPFLESNLCFEMTAVLISRHNERRPHMVSKMLPCRRLRFCPVRVSRHNQVALRDHVVNACWILRRSLPLEAVSCPSSIKGYLLGAMIRARSSRNHLAHGQIEIYKSERNFY